MPKIVNDEEVYEAVMRVVAAHGYSGATTRQMAAAAHVSEVTLFRKYGSKKELVKQAISALIARSNLASAVRYSGDLNADLMRILQAYQGSAVQRGDFTSALFADIARQPELMDSIDEPLHIFLEIGQVLARYQDEGRLRKEPPLHAVAALLGPLMAAAMMGRVLSATPLPPVNLEDHLTAFLRGRSI